MTSVTSFFWDEKVKNISQNIGNGTFTDVVDSLWSGNIINPNPLNSSGQNLLTDKLIEKLLHISLPSSNDMTSNIIETRVEAGRNRPRLSVPLMSKNFIQLNSRLSGPFMLIDQIIKIFDWTSPAYTLSVLSLFTYTVLNPLPTLTSIPVFYLLFGIMVPKYLEIHKPEPLDTFGSNPIPAQGPPLMKAQINKPAPEFTKEFILNLTDLQNHMILYIATFDFINGILNKFTCFTNENISSPIFLFLLTIGCFNILYIDSLIFWIPLKIILLIVGWSFTIIMHPNFRDYYFSIIYSEDTRIRILTITNKIERWFNNQFQCTESREQRQAAIFELQKFNEKDKSWELFGYSPDHYTLFSVSRISETPMEKHTIFLDLVKPPIEWEWVDSYPWVLDLDPNEWVEAGYIQYVDIDVESKWVYDLNLNGTQGKFRRRRWIRVCTRKLYDNVNQNKYVEKSLPNSIHDNHNCNIAGVTQTAFTGANAGCSKNFEIDHCEDRHDDPGCTSSSMDTFHKRVLDNINGDTYTQESLAINYTNQNSRVKKGLTDLLNLT